MTTVLITAAFDRACQPQDEQVQNAPIHNAQCQRQRQGGMWDSSQVLVPAGCVVLKREPEASFHRLFPVLIVWLILANRLNGLGPNYLP